MSDQSPRPTMFTMFQHRSRNVAKLFFTLSICGLIMYITLAFYSLRKAYLLDFGARKHRTEKPVVSRRFDHDLRYILIDTQISDFLPLEGQQLFVDYQCLDFNCYLTTDPRKLEKKEQFDAVIINVKELYNMTLHMPRSMKQVYIFYGMEPSDQVPICNPNADNFFNYTWSYKLTSDVVSPFFIVRDANRSVVAPSLHAKWTMTFPKWDFKREEIMDLTSKHIAVAMIARNCNDTDGRIYANRLREALRIFYKELHIFGCGHRHPLNGSGAVIAKKYYFVLVTTAGAAQDYVTDNVLNAYWNNAVPIIKARADLTKFLPPGSYVNAHLQTPEQIAAIIHYAINNPSVYRSFFKWRNYYSFRRRQQFDGICELCRLLNDGRTVFSNSSANLREWWESSNSSKIKCGH